MKRKVIQLAGNTLVVSLPKKWVVKHNVKKGDEVELTEAGSSMKVSANSRPKSKIEIIDAKDLSARALIHQLSASHHKGADEITIKNISKDASHIIQNLLREAFIGFIITKESLNELTIKSITTSNTEEFNSTLRRAFLVTISLSESSFKAISQRKFSELKSISDMEKTNNQLVLFCQRAIVKHGIYGEKDISLYVIPHNLNRVADSYRDICLYAIKNKVTLSNESIEFFRKVNKQFYDFYGLFYKFNSLELEKISKSRDNLIDEGIRLIESKKKEEAIVIMFLLEVVKRIAAMISSVIMLQEI